MGKKKKSHCKLQLAIALAILGIVDLMLNIVKQILELVKR